MSTTEATYTTPPHERLPSQAEIDEPCIRVMAPGRGKGLPFDCWTACFRCIAETS